MLATILFALQGALVDGLHRGESAHELAAAPAASARLSHGRVVDALRGRPIPGATIESWTEENDRDFGGFHRIDEATTAVDGRFAIDVRDAQKLRVRADGYATLSATVSDLSAPFELFPAPDAPLRVRLVDADGRPIHGARITSTYSCAHDVPALDARSDASGEVLLQGFGLQERIPSLRIRAAGYRAIKYLDPEPLLTSDAPFVLRLARGPGASGTMLDESGAALANTALVLTDGDGEHVVRTDGAGRFDVPSMYTGGEVLVARLARGGEPGFVLERGSELVARLGSSSWPDDLPVGSVRVRLGSDAALLERRDVRLTHADGWTEVGDVDELVEFPAGDVRVAIGGAFTGVRLREAAIALEAGETAEVVLDALPEPLVTVVLHDDTVESWVQAGDRSVDELTSGEPMPVPGEQPLVFCARTDSTEYVARRARATDGMVVDLTEEGGDAIADKGRGRRTIRVRGEGARPGVVSPGEGFTLEETGDATYRLVGPIGVPVYVRATGRGIAPAGTRVVLDDADAPAIGLDALPLASLEIECPAGCSVVGLDERQMRALHPGPLRLVIECGGGRRIGVALELAPGESRTLHVLPQASSGN